ncbi:MAG: hypothetical protein AAFV53_09145 [Myxococcota bacterium]
MRAIQTIAILIGIAGLGGAVWQENEAERALHKALADRPAAEQVRPVPAESSEMTWRAAPADVRRAVVFPML